MQSSARSDGLLTRSLLPRACCSCFPLAGRGAAGPFSPVPHGRVPAWPIFFPSFFDPRMMVRGHDVWSLAGLSGKLFSCLVSFTESPVSVFRIFSPRSSSVFVHGLPAA